MRHNTQKYIAGFVFPVLFIALLTIPFKPLNAKPLNDAPQVLFIGNSYFQYNDQPAMFKALCDSAGRNTLVSSYLRSGTSLLDNVQDEDCHAKIASRPWDFVIAIGGSRGVAYPRIYPELMTYQSILSFRSLTLDSNDSGRFVNVMPWAFEDGMLWMGMEDDYAAMQQEIYSNTLRWSQSNDYTVAPVGKAWLQVLDSLDYPTHYLHLRDMNHPTPQGSYLTACVLYCTVFQDSCIGNSYHPGIPQAEAEWYQSLASELVLTSPELWNLPGIETATSFKVSTLQRFDMTCYPNPFNPAIAVSMEYGIGSNTAVKIYDISGRLVHVLHEGYLDTGVHSFHWNASDVPAGVYIVRAEAGREVQTKKIAYLP